MDNLLEFISEIATDKACDLEAVKLPFGPRRFRSKLQDILRGWRVVVFVGATLAALVLISNIALLAWAQDKYGDTSSSGILTIYTGDCHHSNTAFLWSHLAINVAGSLLLAASNAACQCLSAPTRDDVNRLHGQGKWLDIGIPSYRNLWYLPVRKRVAWMILVMTSVPLHLLYNSIIFPTTTANTYIGVVTSRDFLDLDRYEYAAVREQSGRAMKQFNSTIARLHREASTLVNMTNEECIKTYSADRISLYQNVLVITSGSSENATIYGTVETDPFTVSSSASQNWVCMGDLLHRGIGIQGSFYTNVSTTWASTARCDHKRVLQDPSNWQFLPSFEFVAPNSQLYVTAENLTSDFSLVDASYCLAERTTPQCTINLSRSILIAVILANLAKLICFCYVLYWANDRPIVTIGDAVCSFLQEPDPFTKDMGPLSAVDVRAGRWKVTKSRPRKFTKNRLLWFHAASWRRWAITTIVLGTLYVAAIWLCYKSSAGLTSSEIWAAGFGVVQPSYIIPFSMTTTLTGIVLLANLPQLLISLAYVFWNNILTSCLLASEYADYAIHRKPLRVTSRLLSQRDSYWLQIPYRYAIPLLISFTVLHWLTSQSIFLVRLKSMSDVSPGKVAQVVNGCGYSPVAIIFTTAAAGIVFVALYLNGFRRFPAGIPIVGSCSAAIAASCHAGAGEGPDMVQYPLMYGVLKGTGTRRKLFRRRKFLKTAASPGEDEVVDPTGDAKEAASQSLGIDDDSDASSGKEIEYHRVGFSSLDVEALVDGRMYL